MLPRQPTRQIVHNMGATDMNCVYLSATDLSQSSVLHTNQQYKLIMLTSS